MKNKFLKIILGLLILLVIAVVLLLWNINPILESLRPKLQSEISKVVKKPVELGAIKAKLFPSFAIQIENVGLKDSAEKAKVGLLLFDTSLLGLFSGEVSINEVSIRDAEIDITKNRKGELLVGGINLTDKKKPAAPKKPQAKEVAKEPKAKEEQKAKTETKQSIKLDIKKVEVVNANLNWNDQSVQPAQNLSLSDINVLLTNLNAENEVSNLEIRASLLGTKNDNLNLNGEFKNSNSLLPDGELVFELNSLDLKKISELAAAYQGAKLPAKLDKTAEIQLTLKTSASSGIKLDGILDASEASINLPGVFEKNENTPLVLSFKATPSLTGRLNAEVVNLKIDKIEIDAPSKFSVPNNLKTKLKTKSFPLSSLEEFLPSAKDKNLAGELDAELNIQSSREGLGLAPSLIKIFDGEIKLSANVAGPQKDQLNLSAKASGIDLDTLSKSVLDSSKIKLAGKIRDLSNKTFASTKDLKNSLNSSTNLEIGDGAIHGINILKQTAAKVDKIPGVDKSLIEFIPEKYRFLLAEESTLFSKLSLNLKLLGEEIHLNSMQLEHQAYTINGEGKIGLDGKMKVNADLVLAAEISQEIVSKEKKLDLLLNKENRIVIPIQIVDLASKYAVIPNISSLGKRAGRNAAKKAISKELEKRGIPKIPGVDSVLDSLF